MKNSFRFLVAFGACAALSLSAVAAPTTGAPGAGRMAGNRRTGGRGMGRMAQALGLSESQKSKIMAITTAQRPQMMAISQNKSLTPQQKMTKMRAISSAGMKKISALLTPAQRQKMATLISQARTQRQHAR